MGFDITGMNPKNLHLKEPTRPDNLFELSEVEQKDYFDKRDTMFGGGDLSQIMF